MTGTGNAGRFFVWYVRQEMKSALVHSVRGPAAPPQANLQVNTCISYLVTAVTARREYRQQRQLTNQCFVDPLADLCA